MRFNDTLHPFDPYTNEQLSFIRYSGYREHQFGMNQLERDMSRKERNRALVFASICFIGIVVLNLLG